ncbi:MAG: hypothetical protein K2X38_19600 [Gemmataceae bacterium]|nr:hypothetical protein [Gemmataceae bacterium]
MAPTVTLSLFSPRTARTMMLAGVGLCIAGSLGRAAGLTFETWFVPLLVWIGLMTAGLGLSLFGQGGRADASTSGSPLDLGAYALTAGLLAALGIAATVLWIGSFFTTYEDYPGPAGATLAWLSIAPAAFGAAVTLVMRLPSLSRTSESPETSYRMQLGALFALLGFAFATASYSASDPENPLSWDTFRLLFRNAGLVCLMAASIAILSERPRRWLIGALIVLHFTAIGTATMAVAPSPNTINHLWVRVFRPYLEFMYLNNAYHFYSPEPGPPTHLWMRLIYDTGKTELDEDGKRQPVQQATWLKLPDMDYPGNHNYPVSLVYQRILAVTENASSNETTPALYVNGPQGPVAAPFFQQRLNNTPSALGLLGQVRPQLAAPLHPDVPEAQQYTRPTIASHRLMQSYARHVALLPPPDPGWKFHSVKIYRVLHVLPTVKAIVDGRDPQDPLWFRPAYGGQYDAEGNLLDPNEPFLYWVLPILRDDRSRQNSTIRNWALKHAGDPNWIWDAENKQWTTEPQPAR